MPDGGDVMSSVSRACARKAPAGVVQFVLEHAGYAQVDLGLCRPPGDDVEHDAIGAADRKTDG
jgi:hypothetical protein